jgi:leader peptidase (prepilin peptidase)/N-methyltransferase
MTTLLLAPGLLAAGIDLRTRRIPNALVLVGVVVALVVAWAQGSLGAALLGCVASGAAGLATAIAARGAFGGGDVKLLAYAGAVVGIWSVPALFFWTSLAGGAIALGALAVRRSRRTTIPYGPAIAAGCSLAYLLVP